MANYSKNSLNPLFCDKLLNHLRDVVMPPLPCTIVLLLIVLTVGAVTPGIHRIYRWMMIGLWVLIAIMGILIYIFMP
jgi:SNF family Na+-dependent transporter